DDGIVGTPQALYAIECPRLAFAVVVLLARRIVVEPYLVPLVGGVGETQPSVPVDIRDLLAAAAEADRALPHAARRIRRRRQRQRLPFRYRRVAVVVAAAHRETDLAGDQRPVQIHVGRAVVAELIVPLRGQALAHGAVPALGDLAGDDVDHAAHGVGAGQRRHRPAD